ncbi:MAG: glycosyltransferase [Candidatus Cloacimonadaceae bacterium]
MRIAFLGPSHPWRGGIAQFAQNLAAKLVENGQDVIMFTFIHQYPELFFPGTEQTETSTPKTVLPTQKILTPYNPLTWLSALHDIKAWNPDVLIVSYWIPIMAPAFGFMLRRLKQTRKIYLIHNVESHEKWLLSNVLTSFAMRSADAFITLSKVSTRALLNLINGLDRNKILQLFHPVYEYLHLNDTQEIAIKNKLLFFGFVKHYKGLDVLLQALAIAIKTNPTLKLVIAGDVYGDRKIYLDLIETLQLKDNVEIHFRYIADEEIEEFFTEADVCVLPYRSATQSGVAQLSFAFEVPVIATKVGGIEEVVRDGENGLLVEAENPQALAEKILSFYNENKMSCFVENIRTANRENSWDAFTSKLLDFLK